VRQEINLHVQDSNRHRHIVQDHPVGEAPHKTHHLVDAAVILSRTTRALRLRSTSIRAILV
jgi:hypothetical protein